MKVVACILWLSTLISCSTTEQDNRQLDAFLEIDFEAIKNDDFREVTEIPYKSYQDAYPQEFSPKDVLAKESLARLAEPKLEEADSSLEPLTKGMSLCYQKKIKEAFDFFDKIYFKYRGHPSYWNQIATCYLLDGNERKAYLYYNKAMDIDTKYVPAINNIGVLRLREGQVSKALLAFNDAVKVNSFALTPIFNLAQVYLQYGMTENARKNYYVLFKKNNMDVDVLSGIANSYLLEEEYSKAIQYFEMIDRKSPKYENVAINYAVALHFANNNKRAKEIFDLVEKDNLKYSKNYYNKVERLLGGK